MIKKAVPIQEETPSSAPQTTPLPVGMGHPEYHFVQSIMEMQKTLGEINASIKTLSDSVSKTNTKVEDLVSWKNKIFGGFIVASALISAFFLLLSKFSQYIEVKSPFKETVVEQQVTPEVVEVETLPVKKAKK